MNHLGDPCGFDGLAYLEFGAQEISQLDTILRAFGFESANPDEPCSRWQQNGLEIIFDTRPGSFARTYAELHGPALAGVGLRVQHPELAWQRAVNAGARPLPATPETGPPQLAVQAMGGIALAFVEAGGTSGQGIDVGAAPGPLRGVDHLTFNVSTGHREYWNEFLASAFGFRRAFEAELLVDGARTMTTVMTSPCHGINLACNEPLDPASPLYRQMREFNGEGIQHVAFSTDDVVSLARRLVDADISPLRIPSSHYAGSTKPARRAGLDLACLQQHHIMLAERGEDSWMLQHFTEPLLGPVFFEFVQRVNFDEGFMQGTAETLLDTVSRLRERHDR